MLVTMKRQVFDSLEPVALAWACIEPTIQQIYGKDFHVKSQVYAQLTTGQRALLMFHVLYGHTPNGVAEFYSLIPYLPGQSAIWAELKAGMSYFGEDAMLRLLEEMEEVYSILEARKQQEGTEWRDVGAKDLEDDPELLVSIDRLDANYHQIAPATLKRIGAYIHNNPSEFVQIED
jgi:hypothetical protein